MYIGIDIGTSEVKALLLGPDQQVIGTAGAPLSVSRPQPGHSEQDPADWWRATQATLASALGVEILTHGGSAVGGALGALCSGAPVGEVCAPPPIDTLYSPDPGERALLAPRLDMFRSLYRRP